jgi:hypothetical protein
VTAAPRKDFGSRSVARSVLSPEWKDFSNLETGMVKWLTLASGYGHLTYRPLMWQHAPVDRGVHVDIEKAI